MIAFDPAVLSAASSWLAQHFGLDHLSLLPFGCQPFNTVLDLQLQTLDYVHQHAMQGHQTGVMLFGEHYPVYTAGRAYKAALPSADMLGGVTPYAVSRGGQMTYHGPGQLVIYPVLPLKAIHGGLPDLLQRLQQWVGQALQTLNLPVCAPPPSCCAKGDLRPPVTGVWLGDDHAGITPKKVASIGLALKHWVTYHGIAINVCNDMHPFQAIDPCGFSADVMTSVYAYWAQHSPAEGQIPPNMAALQQQLGLLTHND